MELILSLIILLLIFTIGVITGLYITYNHVLEWKNQSAWWEGQCQYYRKRYEKKKLNISEKNEELIKYYHNEGLSNKAIAEKIGCGISTIQRAVKEMKDGEQLAEKECSQVR